MFGEPSSIAPVAKVLNELTKIQTRVRNIRIIVGDKSLSSFLNAPPYRMHQRFFSVRKKISPSDAATDAFMTPSEIEFVAISSNSGAALKMNTSPAWLFT
jgi:hypothetical protein